MKKIVVVSLILACVSLTGIEKVIAQEKAALYLETGRKKKDCDGKGICKFYLEIFGLEISYNMDSKSDPKSLPKGTFTIDEKANTCTITLTETEVQQKASDKMSTLRSREQFCVDEDIPFPATANSAFKLSTKKPIIIKQGCYDMKCANGVYSVTIPLK